MGGEGFEPPATRPPADLTKLKMLKLLYHTMLDHPPNRCRKRGQDNSF